MYHQVLNIGEGDMPAVIDYDIDPDCNVLWISSIRITGIEMLGAFERPQIDNIESQLAKRHDRVQAELDSLYREDRAADRAAFKEAYA